MKKIYNWEKASVLDSETDGFLKEVTKMHIVGINLDGRDDVTLIKGDNHNRVKNMLEYHIENEIPIVIHNGICYDIPVFEKLLGIDLSELMVIDTLILSQYLNVDSPRHSLEALAKMYPETTQKFFVDSEGWKDLDWDTAVKRVTSDVEINRFIWDQFKERLVDMYSLAKAEIDSGAVGGKRVDDSEEIYIDSLRGLSVSEHINRILTFLMFKTDVQALQEKTGWDVDEEYLQENIDKLEKLVAESAEALESVMPPVAKYKKVKEPAKKFKKDGSLSVAGEKWQEMLSYYQENKDNVDKWGNKLITVEEVGSFTVLDKYVPPNINGHAQVKDFLFMHGWKPETFNFVRDDKAFQEWIDSKPKEGAHHREWKDWKESRPVDRAVPQVRVDGKDGKELCESVVELAEKVPEIKYLEEYSVMKHRLDTLKGIRDRVEDGKVIASWHGITNTLRVKHSAPCVNLPATSRKYAEPIRGCLVAPEGYISVGSDLSGLENRVAHHFMIPHDPDFVNTMLDKDYDPHILMALAANLITDKEFKEFKGGVVPPHVAEARQQGKTAGYAVAYGGMPASIARGAGVSMDIAEKLYDAYWELNWSIKAVAEEQVVIKCKRGLEWLVNPINGFLYNIRSEKDIWNTLCQGGGSYLYDMWVDRHLTKQKERWGKCTQTGAFHKTLWK